MGRMTKAVLRHRRVPRSSPMRENSLPEQALAPSISRRQISVLASSCSPICSFTEIKNEYSTRIPKVCTQQKSCYPKNLLYQYKSRKNRGKHVLRQGLCFRMHIIWIISSLLPCGYRIGPKSQRGNKYNTPLSAFNAYAKSSSKEGLCGNITWHANWDDLGRRTVPPTLDRGLIGQQILL